MKVNQLALMFENLTKECLSAHNVLEVKKVKNIKHKYNSPIEKKTSQFIPKNNGIDIVIKLSPEERSKKIAFMSHLNDKLKAGPILKQKNIDKKECKCLTDSSSLYKNPDESCKTITISGVIPPPPPLPMLSLIQKKRQWVKIDGKLLDKENKEKIKSKAAEHFNASNYVESKAKATNSSQMMDELKTKLLARNLKMQN